jgi:hypothetical protein
MTAPGARLVARGQVVPGTGASSGRNHFVAEGGSIALQRIHFERGGVDFSGMHNGTINVDISPLEFSLHQPDWIFSKILWLDGHPPEDFSLSRCRLRVGTMIVDALHYLPHPATKPTAFAGYSLVEIIAPFNPLVGVGTIVSVIFGSPKYTLSPAPGRPELSISCRFPRP